MATQARAVSISLEEPQWSRASRIAFRFCFLYFGLYCLTTQILNGLFPIPEVDLPGLAELPPIRPLVFWTASHVFQISTLLVYTASGSGDKRFDWVLALCTLAGAIAGTLVWSVLDRRRLNYVALHKWFYLGLRFAIGSTLLQYGMVKIVPLQMPYPSLARLVEPFGNFSPMGVLWYSIGASPAYEMFAGSVETLGGILLFFPRTSMLGAGVALGAMTQVFMLNLTYDVPVKLLAFHLILMLLFLLAREIPRISEFFFSSSGAGGSTHPELFRTSRANRIALVFQVAFGLLLIAGNGYGAWTIWLTFGGGAPKSPLYGIWNVEQFWRDGEVRPALFSDKERWRRVIFDRPTGITFQLSDDTFQTYNAEIDLKGNRIAITKASDKNWHASLGVQRTSHDQMMLDGEMDRHQLRMQLKLQDRNTFLLVNRGFHWIQDYPFNR